MSTRRRRLLTGWIASAPAIPSWYLSGGIAAANCIAAYTPKGAANLAASYDNNAAPANGLSDGTWDASASVAPTHDPSTGWGFDGATQYLTTGLVPSSVGWSMLVRYVSVAFDVAYIIVCGSYDADFHRFYLGSYFDGVGVAYGDDGSVIVYPILEAGVLGLAGAQGFRDGISDGSAIVTCVAPTTLPIYVGACNAQGSPDNWFTGSISALAIYNRVLIDAEMLAVSNAMAAL
jgi:hypothetical protein